MQVTITIKGQCIIYFKDMWHVIFVTDEKCHSVNFSHNPQNGGDPKDGPLKKADVPQLITFFAKDATPARFPQLPNAFNDLINLSADYMHGVDTELDPNGQLRSNLKVQPNRGFGRQFIHMQVPYGNLQVDKVDLGYLHYFIEEVGTGLPKTFGRPLASSVSISFSLVAGNDLTMTIEDLTTHKKEDRFYSSNEDHTLSFNNDCDDASPSINDFVNIYDWVTDKHNGGRQFVGGKLWKVGTVPPKGVTGDCDPVVIEPPPWP